MKTISIGGDKSVEISLPDFGIATVETGVIYDVPDEAFPLIQREASSIVIYGNLLTKAKALEFTPFVGSISEDEFSSFDEL